MTHAEPTPPDLAPDLRAYWPEQLGEEMLAELDTTIDASPSDRQVALEQAVNLVTASVVFTEDDPTDRALATADRFHAWLTQDQEPPNEEVGSHS